MDPEVHEEITEHVLGQEGFADPSIAIVKKSNTLQDEIAYEAWRHFDRVPQANDPEAFDSGIRHFGTELDRAMQYIRKGETVSALETIGLLFHAIQDFCSHSNFIELPQASKRGIRLCFLNYGGASVAGLKLTGYDPQIRSESPSGDSYPHSLYNKDSPNSQLHQQARLAAVSLCHDMVAMIRGKVSANEWHTLKTYSGR